MRRTEGSETNSLPKQQPKVVERLNDNDFSLLRLMPTVLRARDFRLYTRGGSGQNTRRLVDLWQNGGAAVLGHTPPSMLRELKNTASRGLYAPFPHFMEGRYIKALSLIFPGRNFRLYAAVPPELHAFIAPLVAEKNIALWRPFTDSAAPLAVPANAPPVLIPVVPGIQGWRGGVSNGGLPCGLPHGLCVLAIDPDFEKKRFEKTPLPPGDFIPPVLLAVATRGIYDLVAAAPQRANPAYQRIAKALKGSPWKRQGIYLSLQQTPPPETMAALFRRFLDSGFLLPPVSSQPLILPGVLSPGEESKLAELLKLGL